MKFNTRNMNIDVCTELIIRVEEMYKESYNKQMRKSCLQTIKIFCANLVQLVKTDADKLYYSRDKPTYSYDIVNGVKKSGMCSYYTMIELFDMFESEGMFFLEIGYINIATGETVAGYAQPTQRLFDFVMKYADIKEYKNTVVENVIILNGKKDSRITFKQTREVTDMRDLIKEYNEMMINFDVYHHGSILDTNLVRIFCNGTFMEGGRLFSLGKSYQTLPSESRSEITIDDLATSEVDIVASHLAMLYTEVGLVMQKDPYIIDGIDKFVTLDPYLMQIRAASSGVSDYNPIRNLVKFCVMVLINANQKHNIENILRYKVNEVYDTMSKKISIEDMLNLKLMGIKKVDYKNFIAAVDEHFKGIKHYFRSGVGTQLQKKEGDIMLYVLQECIDKNIPVLIIHDSCRTLNSHIDLVGNLLTEAWLSVIGNGINLKLKYERNLNE